MLNHPGTEYIMDDIGLDLHFCPGGKNEGSHQVVYFDGWLSTGVPPAAIHPWTLPRAKKVSTGHFFTSLRSAALFESVYIVHQIRNTTPFGVGFLIWWTI